MDYYLVPGEIAEKLDLTAIRKKTPGGMYLLSESDLLPYGTERAVKEGAIPLSNDNGNSPEAESQQPVTQKSEAPEEPEVPEEPEEHAGETGTENAENNEEQEKEEEETE